MALLLLLEVMHTYYASISTNIDNEKASYDIQ
jgi:hypothetical protein